MTNTFNHLYKDIKFNKDMTYCKNLYKYSRIETREVYVGDIPLGGKNRIRIQSMNNTNTLDTENSVQQVKRIADAGADYVRLTAPGVRDAKNLEIIKSELLKHNYNIPLIADIHFNPKAAFTAAEYVEKVRINPGNFVDKRADFSKVEFTNEEYLDELKKIKEKLVPLLDICKRRKVALRIGTNHGSLSDRIMTKYGDTTSGMVESVMEFLRICREEDFHQIVISLKASNTRVMVQAYRLMLNKMQNEGMNYPLHLGVTEAGEGEDGRIKSAIGIGTLLSDGIGDTIRVSLTEEPEYEVPVAKKIVDYISQRTEHEEIEDLGKSPINPFIYKKRESFVVEGIGGENLPKVLLYSDTFSESELKNLGIEGDKRNTISPDFIILNHIPDNNLHKKLSIIVPYNNYKQQDNIYPLLTIKEFLREDKLNSSLIFVELTYSEINEILLQKIKFAKNVVLIFKVSNKNRYAETRTFFFKLINNEILNPVIIKNSYAEAEKDDFQIKSAVDSGALFIDGLGDGILLENNSLDTDINSAFILNTSFGILQASRVRVSKTEYISCPGCGRTLFQLQDVTAKIRQRTAHLTGLKIGIMGCIVNGPGEMADADYGYVGAGPHKINLYKGQEVVKKLIPQEHAVEELINLIKENGDWVDN